MSSYAKMASKNRLVADLQNEKSTMESLGKIRRSPPREDHYRVSLSEEPTPTYDVEKLLSSPQYEDMEDPDKLVIITDPDEAAAILNGGNCQDQAGNPPTLPRSEGNQDSPTLPRSEGATARGNSPTLNTQELPGTQQTGSYQTPVQSPNSPTKDEWTTVVKGNRKTHCLVSPKTPKTAFEEPIVDPPQTSKKGQIEWVFVTISTVARAAFPVGKVEATVKRFTNYMGAQLCNGVYPPQFRMGPTIKINKQYVSKAKQFSYPELGDLIFQVNPFGPNTAKQTTKKARPQTTQANEQAKNIGIIKGISLDHNLFELKNLIDSKSNIIEKMERISNKKGRQTTSVKVFFKTLIAPLQIGTNIVGFFDVEPWLFHFIRCNYCQRFGHTTKHCKANKPRCPHCAKTHTHQECKNKQATKCVNCGSNKHGAAFSNCPVAVKYHTEIQAKNNAIIKAHKNRIMNQNKSQDPNIGKTKTNPIEIPSPKRDNSKPEKQLKQNNQVEKTTETINLDQIKKEIMIQTTMFILNKLGKEQKADKENIQKEIEDFLNGPKDVDIETDSQESVQSVTTENVAETPKETPKTDNTRPQKSVRTDLPKSTTKTQSHQFRQETPKKNKTLGCTRQLNFNNPNRLKAPKTPKTPKSKAKTLSFRK